MTGKSLWRARLEIRIFTFYTGSCYALCDLGFHNTHHALIDFHNFSIEDAPEWIQVIPSKLNYSRGQYIPDITCIANGKPDPDYEWIHSGKTYHRALPGS